MSNRNTLDQEASYDYSSIPISSRAKQSPPQRFMSQFQMSHHMQLLNQTCNKSMEHTLSLSDKVDTVLNATVNSNQHGSSGKAYKKNKFKLADI